MRSGIPNGDTPLELIGRGGGRYCFVHPDLPGLCFKLAFTERGHKESRRERRYLALVEWLHRGETRRHLTGLYGTVETDHGRAWVVERVVDEPDGRPSRPLVDALTDASYEAEPERWDRAFDEFASWSADTAVVVRDISPVNLFAKRLADGRLRFVLVDGVGPRGTAAQFLPTRRYARRRNRAYAEARGITSMAGLRAACERERRRARAAPSEPPPPVPVVRLSEDGGELPGTVPVR